MTKWILLFDINKTPLQVLNGPQHWRHKICSCKEINLSYWWIIWFPQIFPSAVTDGWASTLLWNLRKALCSLYHNPMTWRHRCVCELLFWLKNAQASTFSSLNEDQEGVVIMGTWSRPHKWCFLGSCWRQRKHLWRNNLAGKSLPLLPAHWFLPPPLPGWKGSSLAAVIIRRERPSWWQLLERYWKEIPRGRLGSRARL